MTRLLAIELQSDPDQQRWFIADPSNLRTSMASPIPLSEADQETHITLIVPSERLTFLNIPVPKASQKKIRQIIPFAVEDDLSEDIKEYHFAIAKNQAFKNHLSLIAVTHHQMTAWLAEAKTHTSKKPRVMVPDCLLLPLEKNTWTLLIENKKTIVRTGLNTGFTCDLENFAHLFNHEETQPTNLLVFNPTPDTIDRYLPQKEGLEIIIETGRTSAMLYTEGLQKPIAFNLLQESYSHAHYHRRPSTNFLAKLIVILLLLFVSLFMIENIISVFELSYQNHRLQSKSLRTMQAYLPETSKVDDASVGILNKKLARSLNQIQGNTFMSLLDYFTPTYKHFKDIDILKLTFTTDQLQLEVQAPNQERLNGLLGSLSQLPLTVHSTPVTPIAEQTDVQAVISLSRNPS